MGIPLYVYIYKEKLTNISLRKFHITSWFGTPPVFKLQAVGEGEARRAHVLLLGIRALIHVRALASII